MLIELLRPAGPDMARRWLAALLLVPRDEREAIVRSVEQRICALYPLGPEELPAAFDETPEIHVLHPPTQHEGYTEQVEVTYERTPRIVGSRATPAKKAPPKRRGNGA